jgi:leucyl-tRNA synthetase
MDEQQEYVVQVNGKVRHSFHVAAGLDSPTLVDTGRAAPQVVVPLLGKTIANEIAIAGQLLNFVVREWRPTSRLTPTRR